MSLKEYWSKRHFDRTAEPKGGEKKSDGGIFVVQKHAASRLHYDFRLELDGVLKSWAVPKGPNLDPSVKALAVQVEDHPIEYASFEGVIPQGEYGGGTVMVWDQGNWESEGDPRRALATGKLSFRLWGEKLKGRWTLRRMGGKAGDHGKNWLLIKSPDVEARGPGDPPITEQQPESVVSKRSLDEIARDADREWNSNGVKKAREYATTANGRPAKRTAKKQPLAELPGARPNKLPEIIKPALATLVREAPSGPDWIFELKFDGYRLLAHIKDGRVVLRTRAGNDWTDRFPTIARAAARLAVESAILDGEVVVLAPDGATDFQALQNLMREGRDKHLVYYVFDLPHLDGYDLTRVPLLERKELLRKILTSRSSRNSPIRFSDHLAGDGPKVLAHACRNAIEGLVAKRVDSAYAQKRTADWVKVKCLKRQEFVIGGWTEPRGARSGFGALLLGYYRENGELVYCGKVGTGFSDQTLVDLHERLDKLAAERPPFVNPPRGSEAKGVHWVRPKLVAEIEFGFWTKDGMLRHSSFHGLREDKPAREVKLESPVDLSTAVKKAPSVKVEKAPATRRRPSAAPSTPVVTHPERVVYPESGITKQHLADYYASVADWILPHVVNRPLSIIRCPEGWRGDCFFQRHRTDGMPASVRSIEMLEGRSRQKCLAIDDVSGLIGLVQMGTLEIHPWGSRADRLEQPDRLILDLDPGDDVPFADLVDAVREVKDRLAHLKLESFVRTTGGKGFHVVAPLERRLSWEDLKRVARSFAFSLQNDDPKRYIATASKAKRKGKIYVDYLRNERGSTAIACYSTRARAGAPVATPIRWSELSAELDPSAYTLRTIPQRLSRLKGDPWEGFFEVRQSIGKPLIATLSGV
jgi:bifunctional non-homologous end joining protein LigD